MKVVTIKFTDSRDWNFLLELLKRLNIRFDWIEEKATKNNNEKPAPDLVTKLFGSFPSDKTSDEFIKSIYEARVNKTL